MLQPRPMAEWHQIFSASPRARRLTLCHTPRASKVFNFGGIFHVVCCASAGSGLVSCMRAVCRSYLVGRERCADWVTTPALFKNTLVAAFESALIITNVLFERSAQAGSRGSFNLYGWGIGIWHRRRRNYSRDMKPFRTVYYAATATKGWVTLSLDGEANCVGKDVRGRAQVYEDLGRLATRRIAAPITYKSRVRRG